MACSAMKGGSLRSCLDLFQLVFDKYFAAADVLA